MNCSHLRRLTDGFVSCDMEWFWNKYRNDRRNLMKRITVEKKGGQHAKECPDFDNKHTRNMELKRTDKAVFMIL